MTYDRDEPVPQELGACQVRVSFPSPGVTCTFRGTLGGTLGGSCAEAGAATNRPSAPTIRARTGAREEKRARRPGSGLCGPAHCQSPAGPLVRWSAGPLVRWSAGPLVRWSAGPLVRWSAGPLVRWSAGPLVRWSAGPLVRWSAGPLVRCEKYANHKGSLSR